MVAFPDISPDFGFAEKSKPRVIKHQFGDGYSQRLSDGINVDLKQFDLTFNNLPTTDMTTIKDFLEARGGWEQFDWTPPDGVLGKYHCPTWGRSKVDAGTWNMSAIFVEVVA